MATRAYPPVSLRRFKLGSSPASTNSETSPGSRPSRPMTITLLMAKAPEKDHAGIQFICRLRPGDGDGTTLQRRYRTSRVLGRM